MGVGKKLILTFLVVIAAHLLTYKLVFEHMIVEQIKNDRHEQFVQEKEAAEMVQFVQLLSSTLLKNPAELQDMVGNLPEDLMYKMMVEDEHGREIFSKTSKAYDEKGQGKKVVAEYSFQHDPPNEGRTVIQFFTDDTDILASKGMAMTIWYIYGSVLVIGLVLVFILARWILRPVNELSREIQEIRSGKRNVTVSFKRNDEFGQLLRYFTEMVEELRQSEERQHELIGAIAHDFRTPLTTIKGYASFIGSGRVTDLEQIKRQMAKIEQKADDLGRLLDELQDYNKTSLLMPLTVTRFHVRTFVRNIIEDYLQKTREANLTFHWKLRISDELHIQADETKLRRVLENLLNNAIHYNRPNGSILLTVDQREGYVLFSVIDKGEGIPEEDLPKVFTKFYRAEKSRNRNSGGTGLGLAICEDIVRRHGGEITVTSQLGYGSCFSFTVPFAQPSSPSQTAGS